MQVVAASIALNQYLVGVDNILPPIVCDAIGPSVHARKMIQPPQMVQADVTVAPLFAVHHTSDTGEVGEVVPVIALAGHQP